MSTFTVPSTAIATRKLPGSGIHEQVSFLDVGDRKLFSVRHLPRAEVRGGVVICSPIKAELMKNYRREVTLARELAARGFATQRFQYYGAGHSDGTSAEIDFPGMLADTLGATESFQSDTGVRQLAFVGTRVGALVAAATARRLGPAALVLWEPILRADRYFREVFRARLMRDLTAGVRGESTEGLLARLDRDGAVDILGFSIDEPLYESLRERTLEAELGSDPRAILLVQLSRRRQLRGGYANLQARLTESGFTVECELVEREEAWWFEETDQSPPAATPELIGATADWLDRTLTGSGAA